MTVGHTRGATLVQQLRLHGKDRAWLRDLLMQNAADEIEQLRDAIEWVLKDMSYKAPELWNYEIGQRWFARLQDSLSDDREVQP